MGLGGVGDVDHVDAVLAVADDAQSAGTGSCQDTGHQMRITDAPDEVRAQGGGCEAFAVGRDDGCFRLSLGEWIGTRAILGERQRFVGPGEVLAIVNHAGRARVNEPRDCSSLGGGQQGLRRDDVVAIKVGQLAPDSDACGDVIDGGHITNGVRANSRIVQGTHDHTNALGLELGAGLAGDHRDLAPFGEKSFDQMGTEKSGAAGDQNGIGRDIAHFLGSISIPTPSVWAHWVRVRRWILALWRTSTGKPGWK